MTTQLTDPEFTALIVLVDNTTGEEIAATPAIVCESDLRFVMSRFAWMRRDGASIVVESPLANMHARILDPRVAALLAALAHPAALDELVQVSGLTHAESRFVVAALQEIGAVREHGGPRASSLEAQVPITWEFQDLLFHTRTRAGRSPLRLSKSALARGTSAAEEVQPGDRELPRVDLQERIGNDPPFGTVVEARRSVREFDAGPVPIGALAELLARVLGPRANGETDRRRFPSGGAVYEIDAVLLAFDVMDLPRGAYRYLPQRHSLRTLPGDLDSFEYLGQMAASAAGRPADEIPPAVVVLTARFNALSSRYDGISYSLMLKHAGVLMAMLNLTAPVVGLGSVPLGLGDSDQFAAATGLDYYRHGAIGEVALSRGS